MVGLPGPECLIRAIVLHTGIEALQRQIFIKGCQRSQRLPLEQFVGPQFMAEISHCDRGCAVRLAGSGS
jgi:hypothetical protein